MHCDHEPALQREGRVPGARAATARLFIGLIALVLLCSCNSAQKNFVVVYTSQDEIYAEPLFRQFEQETGIQVRAVFDSESVKTLGLVNRLKAERGNPQCDVFWSNEAMLAAMLARENLFCPTNGWAAFGYRSRRLVINTNKLAAAGATLTNAPPKTFSELTNQQWRGKVALAFPLFGTTASHFAALRGKWGDANWQSWCRALMANKPLLLDGNSVVVKQVGRGEAWIGMTDSDDIMAGQREGLPITALPISSETLLIPNTVAVVRSAPHPEAAERLFNFLRQPGVSQQLVAAGVLEGSDRASHPQETLPANWVELSAAFPEVSARLKEIFLR